MKKIILLLATIIFVACSESPKNIKTLDADAPMFPDYIGVTIPENIAPLNFILRNAPERICVMINDVEFYNAKGDAVEFDEDDWQTLLKENVGKDIHVRVLAKIAGEWCEYRAFNWSVSPDKVDPYLTYRLIEPDYEVFNNLVLQERCVENFDTRNFSDYGVVGNRCMNCHTYAGQDAHTSMFYVRGEGGGAILNIDGELQKLNLKRPEWPSGSVYFGFSPSRQFVVFSTNKIIPAFHSAGSKRLEVFDTVSDVFVANLATKEFLNCPILADSTRFETFPTFSPDGKYIYFCTAPAMASVDRLKDTKYSLCRIAFDEQTGTFGETIETVYDAEREGKSVCHPRISPDGHYLVFTLADYGTFPIWHREADLAIMDLNNDYKLIDCQIINSDMSDTYHSWSSNSRWLVFASKRGDGLYGKPYYTHIDASGKSTKPFVLPQKHPHFYDNCLKSFNAPEQGKNKLPFDVHDVKKAMEGEAVNFK